MAEVRLLKGGGRALKGGGAWIFDNECEKTKEEIEDGSVVSVADFDGYPLGRGLYNGKSKIRVRMLTRKGTQEIDDEFFRMRLRDAWEYRKKTVDTEACRIIFGEADFLPGLTVDKYGDVLSFETLSLGIDQRREKLLSILKEILLEDGIHVRGIVERNDSKERLKEGMERKKGFFGEPFDPQVLIHENGVQFYVDVLEGQKTGYFLDQKYNRQAIRRFCSGADVLDCFTHTGSFALNAAQAGASSVLGLDASDTGIGQARKNASLNHLEDIAHFETADIFEALPQMEKEGRKFDVLILDPPAFAKSRQNVKNAEKGYREINRRAMGLVRDGGILATCSCSHFMTQELFAKMLHLAANDAHRRLRQIEFRTQSPDHPILWAAEETYYLKFYIFQVIEEK